MKLMPATVTVGASIKSFGLTDGVSGGSDLSVNLKIPDGMSLHEAAHEIRLVELWCHLRILEMEEIRGIFPKVVLEHLRKRVQEKVTEGKHD